MPAQAAIVNARIRTMDPLQPWSSAIAWEAGRIIALGDDVRAVRTLTGAVDRVAQDNLQDLVESLAGHQSIADAIHDKLYITYEEFQQQWVDQLNEKIQAGRKS